MKNKYEIRGDVTAIFIDSPKFGKMETLISTSKLERAQKFVNTWCLMWCVSVKSFYAYGKMPRENRKSKSVMLHRWLVEAPHGFDIDHFDHITLNNTDDNLKTLTRSENLQNRKGAKSHSVSGIRGVQWVENRKKWKARIAINGKEVHLGMFDSVSEAERVAKEARKKHMPYSQEALAN